MKTSGRMIPAAILMVMVLGLFAVTLAQTTKPGDVTGTWKWTSQGFGGDQETTLVLKQEGEKVTGTITGFQGDMPIADGKVKDGTITFKTVNDFGGRQLVTQYTAKIAGDSIKGKSEVIIANDIDGKRAK